MRKQRKTGKVVLVETMVVHGVRLKVPLRVHRDRYGVFTYRVDLDDHGVQVVHEDPQECLRLAKERLRDLLDLEWSPMLLVTVESIRDTRRGYLSNDQGERAALLQLEMKEVQTAERDGQALYRWSSSGHTQEGSPLEHYNTPASLIPDSAENRSKLLSILGGVELLAARVAELLGPERIAKTLADVSVLALPAPPPAKKRKTRRK